MTETINGRPFVYEDQLQHMLRDAVCKAGSQRAFAKECGVSDAFLSDMLRGNRNIQGKVLERLGYARFTVFYKVGA